MSTTLEQACTCGAFFDYSLNAVVHKPGCLVHEMDKREAERRAATQSKITGAVAERRAATQAETSPLDDKPKMTGVTAIAQLHKPKPAGDIPETLRRLADKIERGEGLELVTTAILITGHTQETPSKTDPNITQFRANHEIFALGPRVDLFTVRGLLGHALVRLGMSDDD